MAEKEPKNQGIEEDDPLLTLNAELESQLAEANARNDELALQLKLAQEKAEEAGESNADGLIAKLIEIRDIQGNDGNWNAAPYMTGLFNGLELAVAIGEDREPAYRDVVSATPYFDATSKEQLESVIASAEANKLLVAEAVDPTNVFALTYGRLAGVCEELIGLFEERGHTGIPEPGGEV